MITASLERLVGIPLLSGVCALGVAWVLNDFFAWKRVGTGGSPPTLAGYWRMTKIRIRHTLNSTNLRDTSSLKSTGPSYLKDVPRRAGPRPKIMARTMPQRQHPEPINPSTRARLQSLMRQLADSHPDILEAKPSHTEGRSTEGLYARKNLETLNPVARDRILDHEIGHAHPVDNSLHVHLSDPDAKKVIEAGWGERFPLPIPVKMTMIYAPRNDSELAVVEDIVRAGIEWVTGVVI